MPLFYSPASRTSWARGGPRGGELTLRLQSGRLTRGLGATPATVCGRGASDSGGPHSIRACLFEPHGLAGQEFPMAVLLVPHHQDAELDRVGLAITFALARKRAPYDRGVAHNVGGLVREGDERPS